MTDQYRLSDPPPSAEPEARPASDGTDTLLWIVFVLTLVVNGALSTFGLELLAIPFGAAAAFAGITLLVRYFQRRRQ